MDSKRSLDASRANRRGLVRGVPDLYAGSAADQGRVKLLAAAKDFRETMNMAKEQAELFELVATRASDKLVLEYVAKYEELEQEVNPHVTSN